MKLLIRFILRSMLENKMRTFLILFSIFLSTALFFVSITLPENIKSRVVERMRQYSGEADILIQKGENSTSPFIKADKAAQLSEDLEYVIGGFQGVGIYKAPNGKEDIINLLGMEYEQMEILNPLQFGINAKTFSFGINKVIIGRDKAEELHLQQGDQMALEIGESKLLLTVAALAEPDGFFLNTGNSIYAFVSKETLSEYKSADDGTILFLKVKSDGKIPELIDSLKVLYPDNVVSEPFTQEEIRNYTGGTSAALLLVSLLSLFMSFFIIYTSFKVLTFERLPVIGTYRSIGASKGASHFALILESVLYGVLGGMAGSLAGAGINKLVLYLTDPNWNNQNKVIGSNGINAFAVSWGLGIVLSFAGALIPILKTSRYCIKDIILGNFKGNSQNHPIKGAIGLLTLLLAVICPIISSYKYGLLFNAPALFFLFVSIVFLMPYASKLFTYLFMGIMKLFHANIGLLAAKNIQGNKLAINNITLLAISLAGLMTMNLAAYGTVNRITNSYAERKYDLMIEEEKADSKFEQDLMKVSGVTGVYSFYEAHDVQIVGSSSTIRGFQGVDTDKILDYRKIVTDEDEYALIHSLSEGRNIILSDVLGERFGVQKGDKLQIRMKNGIREYTVTGFINTVLYSGNNALISNKNFVEDMDAKYFYRLYIKTGSDVEETAERIKFAFAEKEPTIYIIKDMAKSEIDSCKQIFSVLNALIAITLILGILGIMNNLIISYLERRRSLAILRSSGMDHRQASLMLFAEAALTGLTGGLLGAFCTIPAMKIVVGILSAVNSPLIMEINPLLLTGALFAGILATTAAALSPVFRSARMNLVETLKYE